MNTKESAVSAIVLLVLEVAGIAGISIDASMATTIVSAIVCVATLAYGIWRNHNLTPEAATSQLVLQALKDDNGQTIKAVNELLEAIDKREERNA